MTVISERAFLVRVKLEAPTVTAVDEATRTLLERLRGTVPGRLSGLRVISCSVERTAP